MSYAWSVDASTTSFSYCAEHIDLAHDARRYFSAYLEQWSTDVEGRFAAELILGEMLSNVLVHAPGRVVVRFFWYVDGAELEVWDEGPGYEVRPQLPEWYAESQRGLFLIQSLGRGIRVERRGSLTVTCVGLSIGRSRPLVAVTAPIDPVRLAGAGFDHDERTVAIDALVALTAVQNERVARHMEAVAALCERTARELKLDAAVALRCVQAARIHDVGLNGIDLRILDGGAPPSERERNILRLHADRSADVLKLLPPLVEIAAIVRAHHEAYDGSGYPHGLVGEEIPLESRIIAVADAFHTMTTTQPYRSVVAPIAALAELSRCEGAQFDPQVVAALYRVLGALPGTAWGIA